MQDDAARDAPAIFLDSSAIIALVDRDDKSHRDATNAYQEILAGGYRVFTTTYMVVEAFDLLTAGVGAATARRWLREMRLAVYQPDEEDEAKARQLASRADLKRPLSLGNAMSRIVMERLGVTDAFAVDPNALPSDDA